MRKLYEKYLEWRPSNVTAWVRYADLERSLGETERCRALFELAITQPLLDMPEALWKVGSPGWQERALGGQKEPRWGDCKMGLTAACVCVCVYAKARPFRIVSAYGPAG